MSKLLLSGNFEEDFKELISLIKKLEEDFDVIDFLEEKPFVLSEHPEASKRAITISMQDLLDKLTFENKMLAKQGFKNMTFAEKTQAIESVKKILFSTNTALGKAKDEIPKKGFIKSISSFLKKSEPVGFEKTVPLGVGTSATKMASSQLSKFLGSSPAELSQDSENDFHDPIQEDLQNDLFKKIKKSIETNKNNDEINYDDL